MASRRSKGAVAGRAVQANEPPERNDTSGTGDGRTLVVVAAADDESAWLAAGKSVVAHCLVRLVPTVEDAALAIDATDGAAVLLACPVPSGAELVSLRRVGPNSLVGAYAADDEDAVWQALRSEQAIDEVFPRALGEAAALYCLDRAARLAEAETQRRELQAAFDALKIDRERISTDRAHLLSAFACISEPIVIWDRDDRLVIYNSHYRAMVKDAAQILRPGVKFSEILEAFAASGVYAADGDELRRMVAARKAQHKAAEGHHDLQLSDGRWMRITESSTTDGGRISIFRDITRFRKREAALRLLLRPGGRDPAALAVNAIATGLGVRWVGAGRLDANGESATSLAFWDTDRFGDEAGFALDKSLCRRVIKQGRIVHVRSGVEPEDACCGGNGNPVEGFVGAPFLDAKGAVCGIVCAVHDAPLELSPEDGGFLQLVAQWLGAELARKEATERVRISEDRFRNLAEGSVQGILVHEDWSVLFANAALARMLGYESPEDIHALGSLMEIFPPEQRPYLQDIYRRRIRGEDVPESMEMDLVRRDGAIIHTSLVARRVRWGDRFAVQVAVLDVTEERNMLQALIASEERFRSLTESAHDAIIVMDQDGDILSWNTGAERIFGYGADEVIGGQMIHMMPDKYRDRHVDGMARVSAGGQMRLSGINLEMEGLRKDGEVFPIELSIGVWSAGGRNYYSGIIRDITRRKKAESALVRSEERFRQLVEHAADAIFVHDMDGHVIDVNRQACESLGYSRGELLALNVTDIDPVAATMNIAELWSALRSRSEVTVEGIHRCKNGDEFPVEVRLASFESGGQPLVLALARDISLRRRQEETLRKLSRAVEQSPATIVITDTDGKIEYVNPRFTEVTGYTPEEAIGETPRLIRSELTPPEVYRDLWATISTGMDWRGVLQNKKKSGEIYWAATSISPVVDETGTVTNYIGIAEDVTHQRQAEERLQNAQRMEAIGVLAGGIAHDFNNILAGIMGHCQLALDEIPPEMEAHGDIGQIRQAAVRAKDLVSQMLIFSRRRDVVFQPVALVQVVEEVMALIRASVPTSIELVKNIDRSSGIVMANSNQIHQVLVNLITNARDAIGDRHGCITVELSDIELDVVEAVRRAIKPGAYVCLTVTDDGSGMSEELQTRIFDPFFTTKEVGKGTGLGLAAVHGILSQHEAVITVTSRLEHGSCFEILFPRVEAVAEAEQEDSGELPGGDETILLIDDDKTVMRPLARLLERLGYTVHTTDDPRVGLKQLRAGLSVDLIISDMVMPGLSGTDVAEFVQKDRPGVPVILYTGTGQRSNGQAEAGLPPGVWELLYKPVEAQTLAQSLRNVLERARTIGRGI